MSNGVWLARLTAIVVLNFIVTSASVASEEVKFPGALSGGVSCAGGVTISIDGNISPDTASSVKKIFDQYHEREKKPEAGIKCLNDTPLPSDMGNSYRINSGGGDVAAAMAIGRMLRSEGAFIEVNGVCISACVLILAGAVDRMIEGASVVGIHRPYLAATSYTEDQARQSYDSILQSIRSYFREMSVSTRLADDMLNTEPEHVHFLSPAELEKYGLSRVDPAEQRRRAVQRELADLQEAKQLGLDRVEHTRRKALVGRVCATLANAGYDQYRKCRKTVMETDLR